MSTGMRDVTSLGAPVGVGDVVVSDEHAGLKQGRQQCLISKFEFAVCLFVGQRRLNVFECC